MSRTYTPIIFAALATAGAAGTLGATPAMANSVKASAKSHIYKGTTVGTQYGPIQVTVTVKSKKITNVAVSDPTHTTRSGILDANAVSVLKQEVLTAQSANVNTVSGATMFSQAYLQSLQTALKKAGVG